MTNPPKKSTKQSLPKPKPRTRQISPKPVEKPSTTAPNRYAPKTLISRPGLGNLRVIDSDRPEYQP